jgi:hypothetical protein
MEARVAFLMEFIVKIALAAAFSGACAYAYLRLARNRCNVRRESLMVLATLFAFTTLRLLAID